jgi:hypothetical protein
MYFSTRSRCAELAIGPTIVASGFGAPGSRMARNANIPETAISR